jgi:hypothetical protein
MSKLHTKLMASIGMAGAIVPTYREANPVPRFRVEKCLVTIDQRTTAAIRYFGKVGAENIIKIGDKIDAANADRDCLGRARSILTYIDYAVWLLETALEDGTANIKGSQGRFYVKALIASLVALREEIAGNRNFECCSIAGIKAAEVWKGL